jgi:hypothetical protein
VRLRRDMGQLLRAIKAHALLHRQHRKRGDQTGAIMATFDDYNVVRELIVDPLSETAEAKLRKHMAETIAAVETAAAGARDGAPLKRIADIVRIDSSAMRRRLNEAIKRGYVTLTDDRKGHPFKYGTTGAALGTDAELLPSVEAVKEAYAQRRPQNARSAIRTSPESRAHLPTPR